MNKLNITAKDEKLIPNYTTIGAAGADLRAYLDGPITIVPGERRLISTGLKMQVPEGYEVQIRPRSGMALKQGITVINTPGTIDSDYRGDVGVVLINHGQLPVIINPYDRIAQMVLNKVEQCDFNVVTDLDSTERGEGGFGHTGKQ